MLRNTADFGRKVTFLSFDALSEILVCCSLNYDIGRQIVFCFNAGTRVVERLGLHSITEKTVFGAHPRLDVCDRSQSSMQFKPVIEPVVAGPEKELGNPALKLNKNRQGMCPVLS